jgi:hypothetical protein
MKKTKLLKIALTLVMAFVVGGVMAQTYPATIETNYVDATETTYQTTGLGLYLYVAPDPAYSPTYDGDGTPAYNAGSEWQWVTGASFAAGVVEKAWANENYVEILSTDLPAVGASVVYWVAERFNAGCADGTGQSQTITVLPEPTGAMVGANTSTNWNVLTAGTEFFQCTDGVTDDLNLTFTETGVPAGYEDYAYTITVTSTTYDADDNVTAGPVAVPALAQSVAATDATFVNASHSTATGTLNYIGGEKTKYEFTLATVASRISTVSHLRAGVANAFYADTDVVTYWLYLPPVTGPIYHIPNNHAF